MLTPVLLTLAILPGGIPCTAAEPPSEGVTLAGGVLAHFGLGSWDFSLDPTGHLRVTIDARHSLERSLDAAQLAELRELVARLPTDKTQYRFGRTYVDQPAFALEVTTAKTRHTYFLDVLVGDEAAEPGANALLRTWYFLRGLFDSEHAIHPSVMWIQKPVGSNGQSNNGMGLPAGAMANGPDAPPAVHPERSPGPR